MRTHRSPLVALVAVAAVAALGACTENHDTMQTEFSPDSCMQCHSGNLVHPESLFPLTTMGSLHTNILCQDCHHFNRGPGIKLFHADCTELCHLQTQNSQYCLQYPQSSANTMLCGAIEPFHNGLALGGVTYAWDSVNHDFCVQCHPAGLL